MARTDSRHRIVRLGTCVLLLAACGIAVAQLRVGTIHGNVADVAGDALPGATVTLSGQGTPQVQKTDGKGQFHFLELPPGMYSLKAELTGFTTLVYSNVPVTAGQDTSLLFRLSVTADQPPK
jgi:hypothetical protein